MYKSGTINKEQADAMHDIIEATERIAIGTPTKYNTNYIATPNTAPSTFSNLADKKSKSANPASTAATVGTAGVATTSGAEDRSMPNKSMGRYDSDTVKASENLVRELTKSNTAVRKKFDSAKSEDAIIDTADQLRAKVKTYESTLGATTEADHRKEIEALLASINAERDRALERFKKGLDDGEEIIPNNAPEITPEPAIPTGL
jgi:hypothetical protein